jgi:hypothetical protein
MNRPQRFRGLATDPGVQRKAPRTVIQRGNKPKGPRLEEQFGTNEDFSVVRFDPGLTPVARSGVSPIVLGNRA